MAGVRRLPEAPPSESQLPIQEAPTVKDTAISTETKITPTPKSKKDAVTPTPKEVKRSGAPSQEESAKEIEIETPKETKDNASAVTTVEKKASDAVSGTVERRRRGRPSLVAAARALGQKAAASATTTKETGFVR